MAAVYGNQKTHPDSGDCQLSGYVLIYLPFFNLFGRLTTGGLFYALSP
jgi:hypothetical protein